MEYFWAVLTILVLTITFMAVGVIFSNRKLKGSCGGLGSIMGEDCMFCEKKDQCEKKKQQELATN